MADVTSGLWLEYVPDEPSGLKLIWLAMDESRGIERNGARMKKMVDQKRMRMRRIYTGFRRARLKL